MRGVFELARREGVGEPSEEARVGLVPDQGLHAVRHARAAVAVVLDDEAIELLVVPLDRDLDDAVRNS